MLQPGNSDGRLALADASRRKSRWATSVLLVCAAAWIVAAAGCGTSVYGDKFKVRLAQLEYSTQFTVLREPTTDLAINFRVPQLFTKEFTAISVDPENESKRIPWTRLGPPGLPKFPGLQRKFEAEHFNQGGLGQTTRISLWIGEGSAASVNGKFPYDEWSALLKQLGFDVSRGWEIAESPTPGGTKLNWKRLTAQRGAGESMNIFQMWVYETPQRIAVLGWMTNKKAWGEAHVGELAQLTAGTATISPAAAAAPGPARAKAK